MEWCGHKPRNAWIHQKEEWIFPWGLQRENGPGRHLDFIIVNFRTVREYISIILSFEATKFEAMCMAAIGNQYIPSQTLRIKYSGSGVWLWIECFCSPPHPIHILWPNTHCGDWTFGRWLCYEGGLLMHGFIHLWDPRKLPCLFCHVGLQRQDSHVWIR